MEITLETIGNGALSEQFRDAMVEVVRNTVDPNSCAVSKRKLIVELTFTPDKQDRTRCDMVTKVSTKLGPVRPLESLVMMGMDRRTGEVKATEYSPIQQSLFDVSIPSDVPEAEPEAPAQRPLRLATAN